MTRHRDRAKQLRHDQTEAETFVWGELRSRRFSGFKPLSREGRGEMSRETATIALLRIGCETTDCRFRRPRVLIRASAGRAVEESVWRERLARAVGENGQSARPMDPSFFLSPLS